MSYDLYLCNRDTGNVLHTSTPHQGGTHAVGGTTEMWLNITWNYGKHFVRVLGNGGIRQIEGLTGKESIPRLTSAIESLSEDEDPDYWKPTEGNARRALVQLKMMAEQFPDGVWELST